jgi:hypothetical protein
LFLERTKKGGIVCPEIFFPFLPVQIENVVLLTVKCRLFFGRIGTENWPKLAALSQAVNSLLFGVSVVAAILALLSLLRVTVFILEISGGAFSTT